MIWQEVLLAGNIGCLICGERGLADPIANVILSNVLQITYSGDNNCGMVESTVARRGQSYFIRMYIHVKTLNQPTLLSVNVNSLGDVQVPLWAARHVNGGVDYSPRLTMVYPTIQQYYDMGGSHRFTTLELARKFGLGYEGVGPPTDRKWYAAAVEVRSDDWVGPIR